MLAQLKGMFRRAALVIPAVKEKQKEKQECADWLVRQQELIDADQNDPLNSFYDEVRAATESGEMVWSDGRGYWLRNDLRLRVSTWASDMGFVDYTIWQADSELAKERRIGHTMTLDMPSRDCPKHRMLIAIIKAERS